MLEKSLSVGENLAGSTLLTKKTETSSPRFPVYIRTVATAGELDQFIRLPQNLYRGMRGYVPPLDMEQRDLLHPRKAPVFRHSSVKYFMAWRQGRPVGRIAAIVDYIALASDDKKRGYFGALDAECDTAIVTPLIEAAKTWLLEQGMAEVRGPVTLNYHGESGLMVKGQDQPPMIATPWHPSKLHELVIQSGLQKEMDLLTFRLDLQQNHDFTALFPHGFNAGSGRFGDISLSHLSKAQIASQGEVLRTLYNDAWMDTYNFVPMQPYEMDAMIKALRPLLRPEHYVQINQNDKPVAMALIVPNLFDFAQGIGPRPSPLGWARLAGRILTHRCDSARVILLGVSKVVRGTILGSLMPSLAIAELLSRRSTLAYKAVELGWILETNLPMINLVKPFVEKPNKVHRMYSSTL